jgi:2-keto-3-deoxygluconate permease
MMVVPLLAGCILATFAPHAPKFFALGGTLNLASVLAARLLGMGLGLFVIVASGIALIFADRLTGGTGTAGLAAATTAGNAAALPTLVAAANPAYASAAKPATVLITASVVVTAVVVAFLTAWWAERFAESKRKPE